LKHGRLLVKFDEKMKILDVRKHTEYEQGHIKGAQLLPLSEMVNPLHMSVVDEDSNIYVHCAGGYRSVIACSLIKKEGYHNVRNVLGGYAKIKDTEGFVLEVPKKANTSCAN
jgi:hydroxyacylglutathione hydrolase